MGCSCSKADDLLGREAAAAKALELSAEKLHVRGEAHRDSHKAEKPIAQTQATTWHGSTHSTTGKPCSSQEAMHDSASSAHALLHWANKEACAAHQTLEQFLAVNTSVDAPGDSSAVCSGSALDARTGEFSMAEGGSMTPRASQCWFGGAPDVLPPYEPHDSVRYGPPRPACHAERVATYEGVVRMKDTKDGELEALLGALCASFQTDMACIALLSGELICAPVSCGLILGPCDSPTSLGFCGWTFVNSTHGLLIMENAEEDARTADCACTLDPNFHLRFYVSAPLLTSDGHRLGTLCILGQQPMKFDATRGQVLSNMAELIVRQLEHKWVMQLKAQKEGEHLARSLACYDMAYMMVDASKPEWRVIYMNRAAQQQLGIEWKFGLGDLPSISGDIKRALNLEGVPLESYFDLQQSRTKWAPFGCEFAVHDAFGAPGTPQQGRMFQLNFRLATSDGLDDEQPFHVGMPPWLACADDGFGRSLFFVQFSPEAGSSTGSSSAPSSSDASFSVASPRTTGSALVSWSNALRVEHSDSFVPRGVDPATCPIEGLVMGPSLGRGSYGRVYRGVYKGQQVAVKILEDTAHLRTTANGEPLEAVLTRGINHLGIMRTVTYAYTPDRQSCWVLFEYCDRTSLQDAVVRGWLRTNRRITQGTVDLRTVAVTAYEIGSAMAFLHKHDFVHGDLKGGNVMLSSSSVNPHGFTAKVGDFGTARKAGPHSPTNAYGTVTHMPPEVLLNGQVGKPTDVYSFGVLLWEMLTTSRAWAGMRHTQIICQVALMERSLAIPGGLPAAIEGLLRRCLAFEADKRCTFEEVLSVLSEFLQATGGADLSSVHVQLVQDG